MSVFDGETFIYIYICFFFTQDGSRHDGDWRYYKQRAHVQKDVISQLKSLLETYGYHLPSVRTRARLKSIIVLFAVFEWPVGHPRFCRGTACFVLEADQAVSQRMSGEVDVFSTTWGPKRFATRSLGVEFHHLPYGVCRVILCMAHVQS